MVMLTAEKARELFSYSRSTGIVTRRIDSGCAKKGKTVSKNPHCLGGHWSRRFSYMGKGYLLHRVIWLIETGEWPKQIDHINGDPADNRWTNLRNVENTRNMRNKAMFKNNTSGIMGVCWGKKGKRWYSTIYDKGKIVPLYWGLDFFEACCRRKSAELKYGYHKNHGKRQIYSPI